MSKILRLALAFSIFPQILLLKLLAQQPEIVETYYSNGLYQLISKLSRFVFGWLPFSFGDLLYGVGVLYVFVWIYMQSKKGFERSKIKDYGLDVLMAISVVYFMFHLLWGLNYYRLPLNKQLNLTAEYSDEMLIKTTEKLIIRSNRIHLKIGKEQSKQIKVPYNNKEMRLKATEGYDKLSISMPFFSYQPHSQKLSIFSTPLAYMGFSGYINPFTNEAQVNLHTPKNSMPLVWMHEQAHQLGYAAEKEANFIAFLAAEKHNDLYFQYAAHSFALRYCLDDLFKRDKKTFQKLKSCINSGIRKDFKNREKKWAQFKNSLEPVFKNLYNYFLKANKQTQGIQSYNQVVGLIVNYLNS